MADPDFYRVHQDICLDTVLDRLPEVLNNDSDPEGDDLTAVLVENVSHGVLELEKEGSFTYCPDPGFSGEDDFIYVAYDGQLQSNEAKVTITVVSACALSVELGYTENTLNMNFVVGTLEPALWGVWLVLPSVGIINLWSIPLLDIDPPASPSLSFPFPRLGTVGILTTLRTSEGVICWAFGIVDTGGEPSTGQSIDGIRVLFPRPNGVLRGN